MLLRGFILLGLFLMSPKPSFADNAAPPVSASGIQEFSIKDCFEESTHAATSDEQRAAIAACTAVINHAGNDSQIQTAALSLRGLAEISLAQNKSALADFDNALGITPNFPVALFGLSTAYLNSGDNEKSVAYATRLLAEGAGPLTAQTYVTRGDAYNNLQQYNLGITDFGQALAIDHNDAEAMNDRAWAQERQGRFAEALQGYDAAIAVPSTMKDTIYNNRSETELMLGQVPAAKVDCEAAQKISPESSDSCFGFFDLKTKAYGKAIKDYSALLAAFPNDGWAIYGRGIAEMELGQVKAGKADIASGETASPNIKSYYANLGISPPAVP